ncbi:unnamed protein product [Blepharisma stoltei]|uniref:MARVEL domain-containing protein n=1 Tax=Blepharisma stoltei TaxID=1481888 RepID=A0AAU9JMP3_9CILI|nr:unnamed protein product [Blepharisma stoltei]
MDVRYVLFISVLLIISSGLAVPYLYESYKNELKTDAWRTWGKLILFAFCLVCGLILVLTIHVHSKKFELFALNLIALLTVLCAYYITFGLNLSSLKLCSAFSDICLYDYDKKFDCIKVNEPETYQGFLHISSLFVMLTAIALSADCLLRKILESQEVKVIPPVSGDLDIEISENDESKVLPLDRTQDVSSNVTYITKLDSTGRIDNNQNRRVPEPKKAFIKFPYESGDLAHLNGKTSVNIIQDF